MAGDYGTAELVRHDDGRVEAVRADRVIGITFELFVGADPEQLPVDADGNIWLAGDPRHKYRPIRFDPPVRDIPAGLAAPGCRVLVCEKVEG